MIGWRASALDLIDRTRLALRLTLGGFTDHAVNALLAARTHAVRRNHHELTAGHVLLGLSTIAPCSEKVALGRLGVDLGRDAAAIAASSLDMKLLRVRFTVRQMMVVVAVISIGIGAETARKRWFYLAEARHLAGEARLHEEYARQKMVEGEFDLAAYERNYAAWAERLSGKYRQAANRPWTQPPSDVWPAGLFFVPPSPRDRGL